MNVSLAIPLLIQEGWTRHQEEVAKPPLTERTGWSGMEPFLKNAFRNTASIPTTPSAPLQWLRIFFLMAQPPLLYQEGSSQPDLIHSFIDRVYSRFAITWTPSFQRRGGRAAAGVVSKCREATFQGKNLKVVYHSIRKRNRNRFPEEAVDEHNERLFTSSVWIILERLPPPDIRCLCDACGNSQRDAVPGAFGRAAGTHHQGAYRRCCWFCCVLVFLCGVVRVRRQADNPDCRRKSRYHRSDGSFYGLLESLLRRGIVSVGSLCSLAGLEIHRSGLVQT